MKVGNFSRKNEMHGPPGPIVPLQPASRGLPCTFRQGQGKKEGGALTLDSATLDGNRPTHGLDQLSCDKEPQATSSNRAVHVTVQAHEFVEDDFLFVSGYAQTAVNDTDPDYAFFLL